MAINWRVVFLGTPDFAVASLNALLEKNIAVVGVVTMPDKKSGRGRKLSASPVKQYAEQHNIPVLQPTNLKAPEFIEELKALQPDIQVVVAFRMLPEAVWNLPPNGTINVHASLLPNYRGAAPINWAIINGEEKSGVTTFQLQHKIDTGNILLQHEVDITPTDNAGDLHDKLMASGAELLVETIEGLYNNTITPSPQDHIAENELKEAPKIFRETCYLNWSDTSENIINKVRGLSPYPGAVTQLTQDNNETVEVKVLEAIATDLTIPEGKAKQTETQLYIGTADKALEITLLQYPNKKRMATADFLRGFNHLFLNTSVE